MAPKIVVVEGLMLDAVMDEKERRNDWREVDAALRSIACRRAALDVEEARWLREAERLQIWRPLGMVSALDYLERVLGYTPHAAHERLRSHVHSATSHSSSPRSHKASSPSLRCAS
jgi:hypothetical protein